ncbi:MAG: amidohydrolase family protein [Planctomycetota bacterium]
MPHPTRPQREILRLDASGLASASPESRGPDLDLAPASVLLERDPTESGPIRRRQTVLAVGNPFEINAHPANAAARRVDLLGSFLLPGLVNAHTHLDLSALGPIEHDPDEPFEHWLGRVRSGRETTDHAIAAAVSTGIELCVRGGVVAVGDIAGAPDGRPSAVPLKVLARSSLAGVCYAEFFAMGRARQRGLDGIRALCARMGEEVPGEDCAIRPGLQPHAPYSVEPEAYKASVELARDHGLPLATHLAETLDERVFVAQATGPRRGFLEHLGLWEDRLIGELGTGRHPVEHLGGVLRAASDAGYPFLCAHVADLGSGAQRDALIEVLVRARAHPVYCPRSSAYFATERDLGPHPYRDMLDAGLPVALGTDSVLNLTRRAELGSIDGSSHGLSPLDEMRLLFRRDGTDAGTLLAMATRHGAVALGLDPSRVSLVEGARPLGVLAVEVSAGDGPALGRVLNSDKAVRFL